MLITQELGPGSVQIDANLDESIFEYKHLNDVPCLVATEMGRCEGPVKRKQLKTSSQTNHQFSTVFPMNCT